jgi:hypothetical protein
LSDVCGDGLRLRGRAVEPGDVRALVEQEPEDARRGPVLERLDLPGAPIVRAYVIELREPPRGPRALTCSLLVITSLGDPWHARIEVRRTDFRKFRRCRSEDIHWISLHLAAGSASLNDPVVARRGVVAPSRIGRSACSKFDRCDTNG